VPTKKNRCPLEREKDSERWNRSHGEVGAGIRGAVIKSKGTACVQPYLLNAGSKKTEHNPC